MLDFTSKCGKNLEFRKAPKGDIFVVKIENLCYNQENTMFFCFLGRVRRCF